MRTEVTKCDGCGEVIEHPMNPINNRDWCGSCFKIYQSISETMHKEWDHRTSRIDKARAHIFNLCEGITDEDWWIKSGGTSFLESRNLVIAIESKPKE